MWFGGGVVMSVAVAVFVCVCITIVPECHGFASSDNVCLHQVILKIDPSSFVVSDVIAYVGNPTSYLPRKY